MFSIIVTILSSFIFGLVYWRLRGRRPPKGFIFPPGPPGKFLIGNFLDLPSNRPLWEIATDWRKTYGEIIFLNVLGKPMIFLNSSDMVYELFVKQGSIYSDRPDFPMINDLMGWDWSVAFMRYGERWRGCRKVMNQELHIKAAEKFRPIQLKHTRLFLQRLVDSPQGFSEHLRHTAGAIIMEAVYGIVVQSENDPYVATAKRASAGLAVAMTPGKYLVDTFPILKNIPEWMPGAQFRKDAKLWRKDSEAMSVRPFQFVKDSLTSGVVSPSMTERALMAIQSGKRTMEDETIIQSAGSSLYSSGANTIVEVLRTFFLAMVLYPHVQTRAQEELDRVVGSGRLPTFEDIQDLPYINAVCKEALRWRPLVPLGVVHVAREDNIFGNYFIPKGTQLIPNIWCITRNEDVYGPETDRFKPERFLVPGVPDPEIVCGAGRRICAGRYFAKASVFISIASILHAFTISPPRDTEGNEITLEESFLSEAVAPPAPFHCTITPRLKSTLSLIARQDYEHRVKL